MKEQTRDKLAILWSMFGVLTVGVIFMFGESQILTGNVLKIYTYTSKTWSIMTFGIGLLFLGLITYGFIYKKFKIKK